MKKVKNNWTCQVIGELTLDRRRQRWRNVSWWRWWYSDSHHLRVSVRGCTVVGSLGETTCVGCSGELLDSNVGLWEQLLKMQLPRLQLDWLAARCCCTTWRPVFERRAFPEMAGCECHHAEVIVAYQQKITQRDWSKPRHVVHDKRDLSDVLLHYRLTVRNCRTVEL